MQTQRKPSNSITRPGSRNCNSEVGFRTKSRLSKKTGKQANKQTNKQAGKVRDKKGSQAHIMNRANVLKAMISQHIQEYRTLALRFPSFLPIRFLIFPLKRPREAQKDVANDPPDSPPAGPQAGPCLVRSLGSFWGLSKPLFEVTF